MFRFMRRVITMKFLILLTFCCGIQADCGRLTVLLGNSMIDRDSVCLKRYKTEYCKNFVTSFNQSDLPLEFPRNYLSVEKPASINTVGTDYPYKDKVYSGMTVTWTSPRSGHGRKNCYGYLIVWYHKGSSVKYCQLFHLNETNEILTTQELEFNYNILKVEHSSDYTVEVHSMPPYGPEFRGNVETFVRAFSVTPPVQNLTSFGIEPAYWAPFISYRTYDNGTIDVRFTLPDPSLNLTRFELFLMNTLNMANPVYKEDYRPEPYSERNKQGRQIFSVNESGCYQIVIWVREEKGFHKEPGKCSCWKLTDNGRKCEDLCGSIFDEFCLNVTSKFHRKEESVSSTMIPTTRQMNSASTTELSNAAVSPATSHYYSAIAGDSNPIPVSAIGGIVALIIVVLLCLLVIYILKRKDQVKQMINWLFNLSSSTPSTPNPKPPLDENDHLFSRKSGELSLVSALSDLTKKIVYVIYADDHQCHVQLIDSFSVFLEVHCHCKVITPTLYNDCGSGAYEWFISNINNSDYIIFVNSFGAEKLTTAHLNSARKLPIEEDFFYYGLKYLLANDDVRERNVILVSFQGKHCQKYLQSSRIYMLPEQFPQLLQKIHNVNSKGTKVYENLLPMKIENIPNLPEGARLFSAIKAVKDFEEFNPDWFDRSFGTLKLSVTDSAYSSESGSCTCVRSVSMIDVTLSETSSPVSVFEQPGFANHVVPGIAENNLRPQIQRCPDQAQRNKCQFEKELEDTYSGIDAENMNKKLSSLAVSCPCCNKASAEWDRNCIKKEKELLDGESIVPPESLSEITCGSYIAVLDEINSNDESMCELQQPPFNCRIDNGFLILNNMNATHMAEVEIIPPETLSSIHVDSVSSALRDINTYTDNYC